MTGLRTYVADLPEAGKPEGQCPECGPHGNRGAVTLLWSIVPCIECGQRADAVAMIEAFRVMEATSSDIRGEGCEPCDPVYDIELLGDHPWARRVRVEVPYRHAKLSISINADLTTAQQALSGLSQAMQKIKSVQP